ncbi:MFDX1 [Symbiodinium sp. KB8]|nr:MFDX1 [Symbiodinium sp. KB8]
MAMSRFLSLAARSSVHRRVTCDFRRGALAAWQGTWVAGIQAPSRWHSSSEIAADAAVVSIVFVDKHGAEHPCNARVGQSLLEVAHNNSVDLEGACEASLACSTCHVILPDAVFDRLEEACEEEEDMLDLAFGLTETSRLGCQVFVSEDMAGMRVQLPEATRNFYVDGHVPQPH